MIEIKNLTKTYGEKIAVNNISLTVKDGEICAFIGHNGAGKTTALKCIVGIHACTKGDVLINGKSITNEEIECKKQLAYIPDNPEVYEFMTGIKYLNFIADIFCVNEIERQDRIEKYAKKFEIFDVLGNPISSYSHGMKQKLVLISALVHSPRVLILDEPFVGLDPISSHNLKEIMKEYCSENKCIFFSTHVLEVAEKLCDSVAIIKDGKIIKHGTMKEIKGDKSLEQLFLETV